MTYIDLPKKEKKKSGQMFRLECSAKWPCLRPSNNSSYETFCAL